MLRKRQVPVMTARSEMTLKAVPELKVQKNSMSQYLKHLEKTEESL